MFVSTTSHDELGHPVTLHLDAYGRAVRKTEPLDLATTVTTDYAYDTLGRLTGITDDAGNQWTYTFDSFGRTLTVDDPDLGLWTKSYDDAGQLLTQTDALAQVTRFTYDALGRLATKTARDGTLEAELTTYTYDQAVAGFHTMGLLTRAENPAGVLQYRYDQMGRELQRIYTLDGTDYAIASAFDIAGRLIRQDYPDGDAVGSAIDPVTYDAAGRLAAIPGLVTSATYDASGNADVFTRANGVVSTYDYSLTRGWLDSLTTMSGLTSIQALAYGRDAAGQITSATSTQADESWTYGYDAVRRLLTATNTDTAAYSRTYTYDTIGNMTSNSGVGTYSYPLPGSPRPHAVTAAGGWTYSYDANGNMETGAGRTFTYNGENRPTAIDDQTYTYGPDGERWKTVDTAPGGTTTLYLGGTIEIASGVMTKYLPGNAKRVGSPGDPLVETFWLHHDHQGSIQAITDAAGTEVQRFLYYPYGDRIATATAHDESKGWIGERQDATGLFYLHARYYDPVIGRFASADPSDPLAPGVGLNRYAYAGNSPIMRVDPSGLKFVGNDEESNGRKGGWTQVRGPSDKRGRPGEVKWGGNWNYEIAFSGHPRFGRGDGRVRLTNGQLVTKGQLAEMKSGINPGSVKTLHQATNQGSVPPIHVHPALGPRISWPVVNPVIISPYNLQRRHPITGKLEPHAAIDFRARLGDPILSTQDGTIQRIGVQSRGGNFIYVQNDDGSLSGYAHTAAVPGISVGGAVQSGQQIGVSDGSGRITGPHLHYTYRPGTLQQPATASVTKVDPMTFQFRGMSP